MDTPVQPRTSFTIRAGGCTRQGLRACNEDRFAIDAERQVIAVADGMGGGGVGDRAAELAVEMLPRRLGAALEDHGQPETAIQQALAEANQAILALAEGSRRLGATVVLAFRHRGQVYITWLGRCRAYHLTGDGARQLTQDHDVRTALIRNGTITEEQALLSRITNVLTHFLGLPELAAPFEYRTLNPQAGDRLVLMTDGLWTVEADLARLCPAEADPQRCADLLTEEALRRGSRDNVACVVATFDEVRLDADWLAWNGGTVVQLARAIHEENAFNQLPILADALEDAGCPGGVLLDHLREAGPHSRGCWALDLIIGKG